MVNFSSEKWFTDSGFYPHEIDQSARFDKASSAYLTKTPSSATNQRTWTWSGWLKNTGDMTSDFDFFTANGASAELTAFMVSGDEQHLQFYSNNAVILKASADLRDTASWYHIMCRCDTTQSTASNRLKFYINGTEADYATDARSSSFAEDFETGINDTVAHYVGCNQVNGNLLNGYLAEVHFTDGVSNAPSAFGETKEGVWIPKAYTGSHGTNGYYLKFDQTGTGTASASTIGADSSGNNNHYTTSGFASTDSNIPDSPTNNFCTWNVLNKDSDISTKEGNTSATSSTSGSHSNIKGTIQMNSGKWYAEFIHTAALGGSTATAMGICTEAYAVTNTHPVGSSSGAWGIYQSTAGQVIANGAEVIGSLSITSPDTVIQIAYDVDNGKMWVGVANTWYAADGGTDGNPATGANECASSVPTGMFFFCDVVNNASQHVNINAGQDSSFAGNVTAQNNADQNGHGDFYYSPPSGYLALCTANLPEPTISPLNGEQPSDHFNTVLWSGNGSTDHDISGVGFQPDFVWIKNRSSTSGWHALHDAVRGAGATLFSNATDAEYAYSDYFGPFQTDGFRLSDVSVGHSWNTSSNAYVGWNWLGANSTASNSDGSITSTVSANTKAGFSIVTYTSPNNTSDQTVGHGLGAVPKVIIAKNRISAFNWDIYHVGTGSVENTLIFTNAATRDYDIFTTSNPTSSVFGIKHNYTHYSTDTYVAYCFAEVEGYSKFGSFTGNGDADGPFVYTGFRPAFVIVKNSTGTESWGMGDSTRSPINPLKDRLYPDLNNAEYSIGDWLDLLSNGFKHRGTAFNTSSATYIYMAFAEMPFKYANAR